MWEGGDICTEPARTTAIRSIAIDPNTITVIRRLKPAAKPRTRQHDGLLVMMAVVVAMIVVMVSV
jgi:hypothetical protein